MSTTTYIERRTLAYLGALLVSVTAGCGGESTELGGDGGAGAGGPTAGAGPSTGAGPLTECTETVDSVTVVSGSATVPHIVRMGDGYVVAFLAGGEAWVVRLDESAGIVGSSQVSTAGGEARLPSVHASSGGFVVLWAQGSDVFARPLDASAQPSGPAAIVSTTQSSEPRPYGASTGAAVAATWMEGAASVAGVLSGNELGQTSAVPGWFPAVAHGDGGVAVAWSQDNGGGPVQVAALDAMGAPVTIPGSASLIKSLVAADADVVVGWEEVGGSVEEIGVARVSVGGSVVAQTIASEVGSSANWPALAWSSDRLAVSYYQFRTGPPSVFVTFYDGSLNPVGNEVEVAANAKYPSAVWGPHGVAVAYSAEGGPVEVSIVSCP